MRCIFAGKTTNNKAESSLSEPDRDVPYLTIFINVSPSAELIHEGKGSAIVHYMKTCFFSGSSKVEDRKKKTKNTGKALRLTRGSMKTVSVFSGQHDIFLRILPSLRGEPHGRESENPFASKPIYFSKFTFHLHKLPKKLIYFRPLSVAGTPMATLLYFSVSFGPLHATQKVSKVAKKSFH